MQLFFVHWNPSEAESRAAELRAAGHGVRTHFSSEQDYRWGDYAPDAVVISLDRLPSHGRAVAEWLRGSKKRRDIPVVFVGGSPDKVRETQEKFPGATYCAWSEVLRVLGGVMAAA